MLFCIYAKVQLYKIEVKELFDHPPKFLFLDLF